MLRTFSLRTFGGQKRCDRCLTALHEDTWHTATWLDSLDHLKGIFAGDPDALGVSDVVDWFGRNHSSHLELHVTDDAIAVAHCSGEEDALGEPVAFTFPLETQSFWLAVDDLERIVRERIESRPVNVTRGNRIGPITPPSVWDAHVDVLAELLHETEAARIRLDATSEESRLDLACALGQLAHFHHGAACERPLLEEAIEALGPKIISDQGHAIASSLYQHLSTTYLREGNTSAGYEVARQAVTHSLLGMQHGDAANGSGPPSPAHWFAARDAWSLAEVVEVFANSLCAVGDSAGAAVMRNWSILLACCSVACGGAAASWPKRLTTCSQACAGCESQVEATSTVEGS